jgi:hypothetical protein
MKILVMFVLLVSFSLPSLALTDEDEARECLDQGAIVERNRADQLTGCVSPEVARDSEYIRDNCDWSTDGKEITCGPKSDPANQLHQLSGDPARRTL